MSQACTNVQDCTLKRSDPAGELLRAPQPQMPVVLEPAPLLLSFDTDLAHNQPGCSEMLSLALNTKPQRHQLQAAANLQRCFH